MATNVTDFDTYKHNKSVQQTKSCLLRLVDLPIDWRFRRSALDFMRAHGISAADLINILKTADKVDFSDESTLIVSGRTVDEETFSVIFVMYPSAASIKVLKMWRGSQSIQQIA